MCLLIVDINMRVMGDLAYSGLRRVLRACWVLRRVDMVQLLLDIY